MEISNKAFAVICVAVVAVTVYVRAQSVSSKPQEPTAPTTVAVAEKPIIVHRPIPNSTLPPEPPGMIDEQPAQDNPDGDAVEVEAMPDQQPQTQVQQDQQPQQQQEDTSGSYEDYGQDDVAMMDDVAAVQDPGPVDNNAQASDRALIGLMMRTLPRRERDAFRLMWFTMSPDERQGFLDQLRGN